MTTCDYVDVSEPCGAEAEYILSAPGAGPDIRSCGDQDHLLQSIEAKLNAIPDDISIAPYVRVYRV